VTHTILKLSFHLNSYYWLALGWWKREKSRRAKIYMA